MSATVRTGEARRSRRRGASMGLVGLVLVVLAAACTGEAKPAATEGQAAMYEAVIHDLVSRSGVELSETLIEPVVFVEVLETNTIDLDTQVLVIDGLREAYNVRFIDDIAEAVSEEEEQAVRPGTLLIVFGPIDIEGTYYSLHAEYYLAAGDAAAFGYQFENRQSVSADQPGMVMTATPKPAETLLVLDS